LKIHTPTQMPPTWSFATLGSRVRRTAALRNCGAATRCLAAMLIKQMPCLASNWASSERRGRQRAPSIRRSGYSPSYLLSCRASPDVPRSSTTLVLAASERSLAFHPDLLEAQRVTTYVFGKPEAAACALSSPRPKRGKACESKGKETDESPPVLRPLFSQSNNAKFYGKGLLTLRLI
jgi:hypothetical protein